MSEPEEPVPTRCPKCGYTRNPESDECPACGVVFSRFRPPPDVSYGGTGEVREGGLDPDTGGFNPYAPPTAAVGQAMFAPEALELADRGARLGARVLDTILLLVAAAAATIPVAVSVSKRSDLGLALGAVWALGVLIGLLAWNLIWLHRYGQTPGKRMVSVKIVRSNGERASLPRLVFLRWFVPGLFSAFPYLGYLFAFVNVLFIFRDDRRCIHDHLADTIVVVAVPEASVPLASVR